MTESDPLMECARALIRRHGTDAAAVAQLLADAHLAASDEEVADFWSAIAQVIQQVLGSLSDMPARPS